MSAIATQITFFELTTSAPFLAVARGGLDGDLVDVQYTKYLDKPWHIHFGLLAHGTACQVVAANTGGSDGRGTVLPMLGELSLDGGASCDMRFIVTSAQRSLDPARPMLIIDQDDLWQLYGSTGVDRLTILKRSPSLVLNAPPGTVPFPPGHIGHLSPQAAQSRVKGLLQVIGGQPTWARHANLAFTAVVDPMLAGVPLSLDANSDTTQRIMTTISTRLAGALPAGDSAPVGSRGHFCVFSGDAARNALHTKMCVSLGRVGTTPRTTFLGDPPAGPVDHTKVSRFATTGMTIEPKLADLAFQASFQGGRSNHGLPENPQINAVAITGIGHGPTATNWDASLPILGTDSGVYYYPGYEFVVPMSQPMVVNALAYDPVGNWLYAATPTGVYQGSGTPRSPYPRGVKQNKLSSPNSAVIWARVGELAAPVEDCWLDGTVLLARCGGTTKKNGQGVDGVYRFPALTGDSSGTNAGYAGWSRIVHSGSPLAAGGGAGVIYYVDRNKPTTVYYLSPGNAKNPIAIDIPAVNGVPAHVQRIQSGAGYTYILTDAGSAGLFCIVNGTTALIPMDPGRTLVDPDTGAPAQVAQIIDYQSTIEGEYVALFAATDSGAYRCAGVTGGAWRQPNAGSGVTEFDMRFLAIGRPRTVLGHVLTSLYAANQTSFLVSNTGGDYWNDLLANRVSLVSFWAALAQQCGALPWPDRNLTNLGTLDSGLGGVVENLLATVLGGGTTLPIPINNPRLTPNGVVWALRLDEHQDYTARQVDYGSQAPLAGIQWHELTEIEANPDVGVITAAEQLALVTDRWLGEAATLQVQVVIQSAFTEDDDAQRDLAPQDMAAVTCNPPGFGALCAMTNAEFLVIEQQVTQDGGLLRTVTTMGTTLSLAPADANALAADAADRITRRLRFGSA